MNLNSKFLMLTALFVTSMTINAMEGDADVDEMITELDCGNKEMADETTKSQILRNIDELDSEMLPDNLSRLFVGNNYWALDQINKKLYGKKFRDNLILAKHIQEKNNAAIKTFHKKNKVLNIHERFGLHKTFLTTEALPRANTILTLTQNEQKSMKPAYLFGGFLSTCIGALGIRMLLKSYSQMNPVVATGGIAATSVGSYGLYQCYKNYQKPAKAKQHVDMIQNLVDLNFTNAGKEEDN